MHKDKIPPQRMHAACRIVTRRLCYTKHFAEFNGNCESFCNLEQLIASLCATHEGKSASGTHHPKTEGCARRYLYIPPGLQHCGGCTWTRKSRQSVIAATWYLPQQTPLEPLAVARASVSCLGERYQDVLSQNIDENSSTQINTDCCTVVRRETIQLQVRSGGGVLKRMCWGTPILSVVMLDQTL